MVIATWRGAIVLYLGMWTALVGLFAWGAVATGGIPWYYQLLGGGVAVFTPLPITLFLGRTSILMALVYHTVECEWFIAQTMLKQVSSNEAAICLAETYSRMWTKPKEEVYKLRHTTLPILSNQLEERMDSVHSRRAQFIKSRSLKARRALYVKWRNAVMQVKGVMVIIRSICGCTQTLATEAAKQRSVRWQPNSLVIRLALDNLRGQLQLAEGVQ